MNKLKTGTNSKSRIDDIERMPKQLAPNILTPVHSRKNAKELSLMGATKTNESGSFSKNILNNTNMSMMTTHKSMAAKTSQNYYPRQQPFTPQNRSEKKHQLGATASS